MKEFSVPMALVDYVPVILFLLAMGLLIGDLRGKMNRTAFLVFVIGAVLVSAAGLLKASYKLLYALHVGDFGWMSAQFFSNQAFGFLLAGIGLMMHVLKKERTYAFLPTMALVGIMVVGLGAMDAGLCFLANRLQKRNALVCFIVSFFLCLGMGYLSTKNFDKAFMNWIAQMVNVCGQGLLYLGCRILHRSGLKDL